MAHTMNERFEVRRVVVALDALCDNRGALAVASDLAARWRCAFAGVFVVDASLVHLGALPGVRQVRLSGGGVQPLEASDLEADIAARERQARRAVAEAAGRLGTTYSFSVARGSLSEELAGLGGDDLLIVEGTARRYGDRAGLESRWRRVAERVRNPVLLLRRRAAAPGPVVGLYDGGPGSVRAIAAAGLLAADRGSPLLVVIGSDADAQAEAALAEVLAALRPPPRFVRVAADDSAAWRRAVAAARPALLVVPTAMSDERWASAGDADVLLMR
ncbi:MAG: hypothetical protein IT561_22715 [Alphaproteobacteria bacterium]|nr:hypothetical protein [Alphaproteobacteria bacterium]